MGLTIVLETENGKAIRREADPANLLHHLLPRHDDQSSQCLRFIDWYADTVFNELQMETFLAEWRRLYEGAGNELEKQLLTSVEELAELRKSEHHLYLKFYGD